MTNQGATSRRMQGTPQPWYSPEIYPDRMPPARRLLVERLLRNSALRAMDSPAILFKGRVVTYGELDDMADRAANALIKAGVMPGDVVGINASNIPETLAATFGVARAGAAFVPINPMNTPSEIAFQMQDAGADLLIGRGGLDVAELIASGEPGAPDVDVDEQAPYWVRFTSGTTGKPRSFPNCHRNIALQAIYSAAEFSYRSRDVLLANAPLAHAALIYVLGAITMGATVALEESFDGATVWELCDRLGVTWMFMVPTMLATAIDSPGRASALRGLMITAAPLPRVLKDRALERFPDVDVMEGYGASELGMISVLHCYEKDEGTGGVGRARWGTRMRILDDDGVECDPGRIGTIYMQGPIMAGGFTGSVPPPENVFRDGWVTAGDMGYQDEDGYVHLVDRRADLIISGGMNVYPAEVENAVSAVDGVGEVAVVATPDPKWGQIVTAIVSGTATTEEIQAHCRTVLAAYKLPRRILHVDALPKSPTGKILRRLAYDLANPDDAQEVG